MRQLFDALRVPSLKGVQEQMSSTCALGSELEFVWLRAIKSLVRQSRDDI